MIAAKKPESEDKANILTMPKIVPSLSLCLFSLVRVSIGENSALRLTVLFSVKWLLFRWLGGRDSNPDTQDPESAKAVDSKADQQLTSVKHVESEENTQPSD